MEPSYSTEIIAFFSGIIISLLSGVGFVIKSWLKNKSVLKECLFSLFKLHQALKFIVLVDQGKLREIALERTKAEYNFSPTPEDDEEVKEFFDHFINSILGPTRAKFEEDLSEEYNTTIKKLASIKPLLAYDISNQLYLNKYLKDMDEVISTDTKDMDRHGVEYLQKVSQEPAIRESLERLQKYILHIAFKASKISWIQLKFFSSIFRDDSIKTDEFMDKYFKRARAYNMN